MAFKQLLSSVFETQIERLATSKPLLKRDLFIFCFQKEGHFHLVDSYGDNSNPGTPFLCHFVSSILKNDILKHI